MIRFDSCLNKTGPIFEKEIDSAIKWLLKIQDQTSHGWGWIQHFPPNEQNTAEVICALFAHYHRVSPELRLNLYKAINNYLIDPERNARITIDWVWVLRGLQYFKAYITDFVEISAGDINAKVDRSIETCTKWLIENQNTDGGWADVKGDLSSVSRTSLAVIVLSKEQNKHEHLSVSDAIAKALTWLVKSQNFDGGWGNVRKTDIFEQFNFNNKNLLERERLLDIPYENIECQFVSNAACTGYAILALHSINFPKYRRKLIRAVEYLKKLPTK